MINFSKFRKTYTLDNDSINTCVNDIFDIYKERVKKRADKDVMLKIPLEEMLLLHQKLYGEESKVEVSFYKSFGGYYVDIIVHGQKLDPIHIHTGDDAEDEYADFDYTYTDNLLQSMGIKAKYYFDARRSRNVVTISVPVKPMPNKITVYMLSALAAAVILALFLRLLPDATNVFINESIVTPIFSKMTALISGVATPLVFLAVVCGIIGIGDLSSLGNMGKCIFKEMMKSYGAAALIFAVFGYIVYGTMSGSAADGSGAVKDLFQLVLDIIPDNLFQPFVDNNALQVITIAILVGIALLICSKKSTMVARLCEELSVIVNTMMTIVCKLLPLIVFFGILNMMFSNTEAFSKLHIMFLVELGMTAIYLVIITVRTVTKSKVPFRSLFKAQTEAIMINLTTSSQVAAIPSNMVCLKEKFGIDKKLVDLSLPLCVVMYMPCGAIFLGMVVMGLGYAAGVPITLMMAVKMALVGVLVAIAAPPIPGSAFAVMPIMFAICGVPDSMYPLAIIFGTIVGYFMPTCNCYCLQLKILLVGLIQGKVDKERLKNCGK